MQSLAKLFWWSETKTAANLHAGVTHHNGLEIMICFYIMLKLKTSLILRIWCYMLKKYSEWNTMKIIDQME